MSGRPLTNAPRPKMHLFSRLAREARPLTIIMATTLLFPSAARAGTFRAEDLLRILTLQDYNTRVVVIGTMLLGLAAGIIGAFMLLRKRALMGDALSHATLPGIGIAFIVTTLAGGDGKSLPVLLIGAAISGTIGTLCVLVIRHFTRLKEDAALGIVLSVFFGLGVAILGLVQNMHTGSAAGLESFIYGKTASMLSSDAKLIAIAAIVISIACALLFKEFSLLCFDEAYAKSGGWPVLALDLFMMALVVAVTVIGLQAVGLILIIALLIIPAAAARFWTDRLRTMILGSAVLGAASGYLGASLSALVPKLPAGAVIVVVATIAFIFSMFLGSSRGLVVRWVDQIKLARSIARQHLLRAIFEWAEETNNDPRHVGANWKHLLAERSWSGPQLKRLLARGEREGLVFEAADGTYRLTEEGLSDAARMTRNHRLWEAYLVTHADVAPSHVDRDADDVEHVIGHAMVKELEALVANGTTTIPASPHAKRAG